MFVNSSGKNLSWSVTAESYCCRRHKIRLLSFLQSSSLYEIGRFGLRSHRAGVEERANVLSPALRSLTKKGLVVPPEQLGHRERAN
jgi:hypothetical protein